MRSEVGVKTAPEKVITNYLYNEPTARRRRLINVLCKCINDGRDSEKIVKEEMFLTRVIYNNKSYVWLGYVRTSDAQTLAFSLQRESSSKDNGYYQGRHQRGSWVYPRSPQK